MGDRRKRGNIKYIDFSKVFDTLMVFCFLFRAEFPFLI